MTTYDHWFTVQKRLLRMTANTTPTERLRELLPKTASIIDTVQASPILQNQALSVAARRLLPVYEKMLNDSAGRLANTLKIFRACRLFGYKYVASTQYDSLVAELVQLNNLVLCFVIGEPEFKLELEEYKRLADDVAHGDVESSDEDFWNANQISLPTWFAVSREILLITPSSAACERLFSLLAQGFSDQQRNALADYLYVFVSCAIRFNKEV